MEASTERAIKIAEFLLTIGAVRLNPENPFTWASGLRSPIYCDNRKTLSFPAIRDAVRDAFAEIIRTSYPKAQCIAGVATGGIAIGALAAQALNLPFIYVRSEAKKHGLNNQVEGHLEPGQRVVVIEDLVSTGKSSLQAVQALREAGAQIDGMVAIFTYGFEKAREQFAAAGCQLETLSHFDALVTQAVRMHALEEKHQHVLNDWKLNPELWSERFTAKTHTTAS
jgi:orotate phosphoribosyltransferase